MPRNQTTSCWNIASITEDWNGRAASLWGSGFLTCTDMCPKIRVYIWWSQSPYQRALPGGRLKHWASILLNSVSQAGGFMCTGIWGLLTLLPSTHTMHQLGVYLMDNFVLLLSGLILDDPYLGKHVTYLPSVTFILITEHAHFIEHAPQIEMWEACQKRSHCQSLSSRLMVDRCIYILSAFTLNWINFNRSSQEST